MARPNFRKIKQLILVGRTENKKMNLCYRKDNICRIRKSLEGNRYKAEPITISK